MAENSGRLYSRREPRDRSLRSSDGDRNAVGAILREANVSGRLDADEFGERLGRCLQARTYAQLDELLTDLPAEDDAVQASGGTLWPSGGRSAGTHRSARWSVWIPVPVVCLTSVVLLVGVAVLTGGRLAWLGFIFFFAFARRGRCRPLWTRQQGSRGWRPDHAWGQQA